MPLLLTLVTVMAPREVCELPPTAIALSTYASSLVEATTPVLACSVADPGFDTGHPHCHLLSFIHPCAGTLQRIKVASGNIR